MKCDVTITLVLTDDTNGQRTITEQRTTRTGGNPRYYAEHCEAAIEDLACRINAATVARYGDIRANA